MTGSALTVETRDDGPALTIAVIGRLDSSTVKDIANGVVEAVQQFVGSAPQFDDLTCIALRYKEEA